MYTLGDKILPVTGPAVATGAVALLPETANSMWIMIAAAVAAGMLAWGIAYRKKQANQ